MERTPRPPDDSARRDATNPRVASELVAACEHGWAAIQAHHPQVPDVVIVLGTGVERGRLVKLGHWWGGRWLADGNVRGEVLLAGEALHLPPSQVFEVLLHEAAHGLNAARGIKDSSRGGRYHNTRFRTTAEDLGLAVAQMVPYGWASTSIGPIAAERYAAEITGLGEAMRIARRIERGVRLGTNDGVGTETSTTGDTSGRREHDETRHGPSVCGCGRKLRMAPSVLAQGPVLCGLCGEEFTTTRRAEHRPASQEPGDKLERTSFDGLNATQREGIEVVLAMCGHHDGAIRFADIAAWYGARSVGDERPLLGATQTEVDDSNALARAMLKLDGTLRQPSVTINTRELATGEHVMVGDHAAPILDVDDTPLPPPGVFGTVEHIDVQHDEFTVEFAIEGSHRFALGTAAASVLEYGYAQHVATVGAPLIDLRTLPDAPRHDEAEIAAGIELGW